MDIGKVGAGALNTQINNMKSETSSGDFEKRLKSAMENNKDEKELKKVCQEFEAMILGMMYKEMRASVPKSDLIPEDQGKEVFQSMLDDELVKEASKNGSFGLADTLYKQLGKQLNATYKPNSGGNT